MQRIALSQDGSQIALFSHFKDKDMARSIPGRTWDPTIKAWTYPLRPESLESLRRVFPGAYIDPVVPQAVSNVVMREAVVSQSKMQGWESAEPEQPMPIRTKPFRHQVLGFNIACKLMGVFEND